jgi:hypothetical protein
MSSHGLDHTLLGGLPPPELGRQFSGWKRWLEKRFAGPVEALALPGGSGGARVRRAAAEAGYCLVLGSRPGTVRGSAALGIQSRLGLRRGYGLSGFRVAVDQRAPFLLWQALQYRILQAGRSLLGARAYGRLRICVQRSEPAWRA